MSALEDLRTRYEGWFRALPARDLGFFERTLADDWVYTDVYGTVRGKDEYVKLVGQLVSSDHRAELVALDVREYGDTAVATGRYTVDGTFTNGLHVVQNSRFTAVWVRDAAGWRCVAHQANNIVDSPY
jgi:ketosteroid isomerase-like protein